MRQLVSILFLCVSFFEVETMKINWSGARTCHCSCFFLYRGVPQIEVTFEVDANSILHVKAQDKAAKKSQSITISNEKGRLSKGEIEQMVKEAEEFAEEDKKVKERIDAKNSLETYIYNMKTTISDKLADKISGDDKEKIKSAVNEGLEWLDSESQNAGKEDFEEKMKEIEATCNPIIKQVYDDSNSGSGYEKMKMKSLMMSYKRLAVFLLECFFFLQGY